MGKTKKDKIRGKYNRANHKDSQEFDLIWKKMYRMNPDWSFTAIWQLCRERKNSPYDNLTEKEKLVLGNYGKNPSWWNLLFNRVPKRRADRDLLKKLKTNPDKADGCVFSVDRKPNAYYW
jgi:hypothetical protein